MPPAASFSPGDAVEIASNDDGFRGSWFTGIVIRLLSAPSSSGRRKTAGKATLRYLIQFDTLFEDEAGTKRLMEEVDERAFKLGEEVDAYYNDGWWEGSITAELGSGKFEVYFRASKESIQFKSESLRLHREWTNNAWFPPFDEEKRGSAAVEAKVAGTTNQRFKKGALVEVSSDEDGFRGAWFSAKIDKEISKGKYLVQYQNFRNDDDTNFLLEEIDALHIRPRPPQTKASGDFKLLDEVDALYNDGWWVGVVSKVLKNSRFFVYFRDTNEELEFSGSELRPHQEWIGGKWIIASQ
ncbi:hypothetical protein CRG98_011292, partial [Punica granatum]